MFTSSCRVHPQLTVFAHDHHMRNHPISPEMFFATLFGSKSARNGAVIRRKVRDVERFIGRDVFCRELGRRGYSAVENAGQFVIFCNREPVRKVKTLSETESVPGE